MSPICPYCKSSAELVTGAAIYPHRPDLSGLNFWRCKPCRAHVGCHQSDNNYGDGTRPLGRLANAELRAAKQAAHAAFDPLWKSQTMRRRSAYRWLAGQLGIPINCTHIAEFDLALCRQVVRVCKLNPPQDAQPRETP